MLDSLAFGLTQRALKPEELTNQMFPVEDLLETLVRQGPSFKLRTNCGVVPEYFHSMPWTMYLT